MEVLLHMPFNTTSCPTKHAPRALLTLKSYFMVQTTRFQSPFAREGRDQVSTLFFPVRAARTKESIATGCYKQTPTNMYFKQYRKLFPSNNLFCSGKRHSKKKVK